MKHILFNQAASGSLKHALKGERVDIIAFPDSLGAGPIHRLLTEEGITERLEWLQKAYRFDEKMSQQYVALFHDAIIRIQQIEEGDSVIIWTCENAAEQFGLRLVSHLLSGKKCAISVCNTYFPMLYFHEDKHAQFDIRHSGEVSPDQMKQMLKLNELEQLTEGKIALLKNEALQLMEGHSTVRTWVRGRMIEDIESRDDESIIQYANEFQSKYGVDEFYNATRLIGHVLGWSQHDISDTWIDYRLRMLIKNGVFDYTGDTRDMRSYQVRLKKEPKQ
ncbi:DUF1835 domain-containing protein [Peribacillus sp. NPDC097295]|uniref:DUF1835 domain-containing protein n=1 Tax=Peribacillus sp. NPDC097295 TaxID=3364402 RepID=UPI00381AA5E9